MRKWAYTHPRKPAEAAFTAGLERQIAYMIEDAENRSTLPPKESYGIPAGFALVPVECTPQIKEWMLQAESGEWSQPKAWRVLLDRLGAPPNAPTDESSKT